MGSLGLRVVAMILCVSFILNTIETMTGLVIQEANSLISRPVLVRNGDIL